MSNWEVRQDLCGLCIIVKGFIKKTNADIIRNIFPESVRSAPVIRSLNFELPKKEWIVQFRAINGIYWFITKSPVGVGIYIYFSFFKFIIATL